MELILVLVLIAAVALVAAMAMNGGLEGVTLRSAGRTLAAELRYTRARAVATGAPQQLEVDVRGGRWLGPNGRHGELPKSVSLHYMGARQVQRQDEVGVIRFFGDGASTGGQVDLKSRSSIWRINVNWITGEVRTKLLYEGSE